MKERGKKQPVRQSLLMNYGLQMPQPKSQEADDLVGCISKYGKSLTHRTDGLIQYWP